MQNLKSAMAIDDKLEFIFGEYNIPEYACKILPAAIAGSVAGAVVASSAVGSLMGFPFIACAAATAVGKIAKAIEGNQTDNDIRKKQLKASDIPDNIIDGPKSDLYVKILDWCEQKHIDEVTLYKNACISRSVFSNIRSMNITGHKPKKMTVVAICLALGLDLQQSTELLNIAGYAFSQNSKVEKLIAWCLENTTMYEFSVMDINDIIYEKLGEAPFVRAS